jgi:SAM-dependent methyltransferase
LDQEKLSEIIPEDVKFRLIEPGIYSLCSKQENISSYDKTGGIYDVVACNRFYNRLVWGYWPDEYHYFCLDTLALFNDGWILDAACGSLGFTVRTYVDYSRSHPERPIILLDQSIRLLRMAKARIIKLAGQLPRNMIFFHGDARRLPFLQRSFRTIISMNLLHVLDDPSQVVLELKRSLSDNGTISFTTLIRNSRFSDKYLNVLGNIGALIPRTADQLRSIFDEIGMSCRLRIKGNLAFISCANS